MKKILFTMLCALPLLCLAQAKPKVKIKNEPLDAKINRITALTGEHQEGTVSAYYVSIGSSSKGMLPDPKKAGLDLSVNLVITPITGHTVTHASVNFVTDAANYDNAIFESSGLTVYQTLPVSSYDGFMQLLSQTVGSSNGRTLKLFFFSDDSGKSVCFFVMQ
jgi:hypothetical protein